MCTDNRQNGGSEGHDFVPLSLSHAYVDDGDGHKDHNCSNKDRVEHSLFSTKMDGACAHSLCKKFREPARQNFTSMDRLIRFSIFLRSGVNPGTKAPGDPQIFSTIGAVEQDVGVTPPGPEKYGTFAARWSNSPRKVMYWLGM